MILNALGMYCTNSVLRKNCSFDGSFKPSCKQDVISPSLMGLANIQHQSEVAATITRAVLDLIY